MIGLIVILVLGVLLVLAIWAFVWTYKAKRRQGKSDMQSFAWAVGAVVVLSLPIASPQTYRQRCGAPPAGRRCANPPFKLTACNRSSRVSAFATISAVLLTWRCGNANR